MPIQKAQYLQPNYVPSVLRNDNDTLTFIPSVIKPQKGNGGVHT